MPIPVNLADMGRRARIARLARRLTLEEVVSRAQFTISWLSKLENGQLTPSLEGLVKLAEVLECGVDTLVEGLSIPPQYVVIKHGEGRIEAARDERDGYLTESLADQWRDRAMNPMIVHLSGVGNRHRPDNHNGERFLLVLDGEVLAWDAGTCRPLPFAVLQTRVARRTLTAAVLRDAPVAFVAYDLLERDGLDWRGRPQAARRAALRLAPLPVRSPRQCGHRRAAARAAARARAAAAPTRPGPAAAAGV
jgi:transcriptional regulator with XRE-family HTH domain